MMPQVIIGMPIYRHLHAETLLSVAGPCLRFPQWIHDIKIAPDTYIDDARNFLAELACDDEEATHLWMIDADMDVPQDALQRLLGNLVPVVGGWYCAEDGNIVAWDFLDEGKEGLRCEPVADCTESLRQVGGVGTGCLLIETRILRSMRERFGEDCWFQKQGREIREDVFFSLRLREMGISVYLDNTVECGHMKTMCLAKKQWEKRRTKHAALAAVD